MQAQECEYTLQSLSDQAEVVDKTALEEQFLLEVQGKKLSRYNFLKRQELDKQI